MRDARFWTLHFIRFVLVFGAAATFTAFMIIFRFMLRYVSGIGY